MKGVQCYELFGGIALKNHAFQFSFSIRHKSILVTNDFNHGVYFTVIFIAWFNRLITEHNVHSSSSSSIRNSHNARV